MQEIKFFRLRVFGEAWQETAENGNLVFQNRDNIVKPNNVLPDLIFLHLANNDLAQLEKYFLDQGFLGFPAEFIDPKVPVTSIGVSRNPNLGVRYFTPEKALEYIGDCFGNPKTTGRKL